MEFQTYICENCKHFKECFPNSRTCNNAECYWGGALNTRSDWTGFHIMDEKNFSDFEPQEEDLEIEIGVGEF